MFQLTNWKWLSKQSSTDSIVYAVNMIGTSTVKSRVLHCTPILSKKKSRAMSMLKTQKLLDSLILDLEKSLGLPSSKDAKDSGVKGSGAAAPAKKEPAAKEAANKQAIFFFLSGRLDVVIK
jgi:hypothetical protein